MTPFDTYKSAFCQVTLSAMSCQSVSAVSVDPDDVSEANICCALLRARNSVWIAATSRPTKVDSRHRWAIAIGQLDGEDQTQRGHGKGSRTQWLTVRYLYRYPVSALVVASLKGKMCACLLRG